MTYPIFFDFQLLHPIAKELAQENSENSESLCDESDQFGTDSKGSSAAQNSELSKSSKTFNCSDQGFKYVVGYLARSFQNQYPQFGEKTCETPIFEEVDSPWIYALSRGGLTAPSREFIQTIQNFEEIFKSTHGETLCKKGKLIGSMVEKITKAFPDFPPEVIKKYVRTRTFIRIRDLNYLIKAENEARKARNAEKRKHFTT